MELRNVWTLGHDPGLVLRMGVVLVFATLALFMLGFQQNPIVHETLHDLRHAAGFPCH